jgi:hypothetical protein
MTIMTKLLAGAAGLAAIAATAPASAQYAPRGYTQPYAANPYAYGSQYGYGNQAYGNQAYGNQAYGNQAYGMNTSVATQQCTAAVQSRLYNRNSIGGILGAVLGSNTTGRVVGVTAVQPRGNGLIRVLGVASSGRYARNNYSPYGVGAYGALGYNSASAADLSFRCDVDPRGYVRSVKINRR